MPKNNTPQTELYLIRHAETVMNTNPHLVGGRSNETPLTEHGVLQARFLGANLLRKNILADAAFTSPARRTKATGIYAHLAMAIYPPIYIEDEIQELSQGPWEGRLRSETYTDEVMTNILRLGKDFKLEGGESMNEVGVRMHNWALDRFGSGGDFGPGRYYVYTHGGAIKYLASHLLDWNHAHTYATEIDNTSVSLFTLTGNQLEVAYLNRNAAEL